MLVLAVKSIAPLSRAARGGQRSAPARNFRVPTGVRDQCHRAPARPSADLASLAGLLRRRCSSPRCGCARRGPPARARRRLRAGRGRRRATSTARPRARRAACTAPRRRCSRVRDVREALRARCASRADVALRASRTSSATPNRRAHAERSSRTTPGAARRRAAGRRCSGTSPARSASTRRTRGQQRRSRAGRPGGARRDRRGARHRRRLRATAAASGARPTSRARSFVTRLRLRRRRPPTRRPQRPRHARRRHDRRGDRTTASALTGLAYGATIMPVRVLDRDGEGDAVDDRARASATPPRHGAKVINLSFEFDTERHAPREIPEHARRAPLRAPQGRRSSSARPATRPTPRSPTRRARAT